MEKLIGAVLSDNLKAEIANFCKQYDPRPAEPYLALLTPTFVKAVKGLDRKMQSFCLSQLPFKTVIGGPNIEHSDNGTIIYLGVMMGPLNAARDKLMKYLHIQSGVFFRAQLVIFSFGKDSGQDFDVILENAKKTFSRTREFPVTALAMYSRKSGSDNFVLDVEYPFTGR